MLDDQVVHSDGHRVAVEQLPLDHHGVVDPGAIGRPEVHQREVVALEHQLGVPPGDTTAVEHQGVGRIPADGIVPLGEQELADPLVWPPDDDLEPQRVSFCFYFYF